MFDWLYYVLLAISLAAGALNLLLAAFKRLPSLVSLGAAALVELGLLVQLIATIVALASGQTSKGNVFEFFGYLFVALLIPAAAVFWGLSERNRQSTVILGIAPLVISVMLLRMDVIWGGF